MNEISLQIEISFKSISIETTASLKLQCKAWHWLLGATVVMTDNFTVNLRPPAYAYKPNETINFYGYKAMNLFTGTN